MHSLLIALFMLLIGPHAFTAGMVLLFIYPLNLLTPLMPQSLWESYGHPKESPGHLGTPSKSTVYTLWAVRNDGKSRTFQGKVQWIKFRVMGYHFENLLILSTWRT